MYKCCNCGAVFDEPYEKHTTYESYYGIADEFSYHTPLTLYVCPCCSDDDYEEYDEYEEGDEL